MSSLLPDDIKKEVKEKFSKELKNPVTITYFTMELECQFCKQTHQLLDEIVALSDKISLTIYEFDTDKETAKKFNIDKIPAIAISGEKDYGIRMYGMPSGYEFTSLIESILMVSKGEAELKKENLDKIGKISHPIHIQVFVTNT